jgi:hypothetical protein
MTFMYQLTASVSKSHIRYLYMLSSSSEERISNRSANILFTNNNIHKVPYNIVFLLLIKVPYNIILHTGGEAGEDITWRGPLDGGPLEAAAVDLSKDEIPKWHNWKPLYDGDLEISPKVN